MAKPENAFKALFKELNDEQKQLADQWVKQQKGFANCAIFMVSDQASEKDKMEFCVLLRKAIDAGDFSALAGVAVESKDEPQPPTQPDEPAPAEAESEPKDQAKPHAEQPASSAKPKASATEDMLLLGLQEFIDDRIKLLIAKALPNIVEAVIEKIGATGDSAATGDLEQLIRQLVTDETAVRSAIETLCAAQIKARFQALVG